MFATVEKYSMSAKIILGLISLTFVGFGVSVATPDNNYITQIGNEKITENQLNLALQNAQANGSEDTRSTIYNSLLQRAYLTQGAENMGIDVSNKQVKQIIVDDPNFHNSNGKFDQNLLTQYLTQRHISEEQFVEEIRQQYALQNLMNIVQNGALVSDAQAEQLLNLTQSQRTIRTITFSPAAFASQIQTDDASLKAYYEAHKKDFTIPQAVKLEYIALSAKDLAAKQTVSEEELKKAFDTEAATAQPKRDIAHIFFPVAQNASAEDKAKTKAEAEKVLAKVKANPASFAKLAKQYSQDPASAQNGGDLGYLANDGGLDKAFTDVAFSLKLGDISNVVQSAYGFHIITIKGIQDKPSFTQEKPRLEAELKQQKATQEFAKLKETLSDAAFNNPNSLAEAAKKTGLKIETPNEWLTQDNGKAAGMPDNLIKAIFSDDVLKKKHNSEPISINDDTIWVVRAKEVRPESVEPFDKAKDLVKIAYLREEATKKAEEQAKKALVDLKTGEKTNLTWSPVSQLTADQARQSMPPEAYQQLLKARPSKDKPAYVLLEGLPAPVLMEVQAIKAPDNVQEQLPQARQFLAQNQVNNVYENLLSYLQSTIKSKAGSQTINEDTSSKSEASN